MKTTRYEFEKAVHNATSKTVEWLKEQFRSILESDKDPIHAKRTISASQSSQLTIRYRV